MLAPLAEDPSLVPLGTLNTHTQTHCCHTYTLLCNSFLEIQTFQQAQHKPLKQAGQQYKSSFKNFLKLTRFTGLSLLEQTTEAERPVQRSEGELRRRHWEERAARRGQANEAPEKGTLYVVSGLQWAPGAQFSELSVMLEWVLVIHFCFCK